MSFDAKTLYELLPAIYRLRDAGEGYPLRDLVAVLAETAAILEEDLEQLYDDQFIETCADWAAPYIGSLVGYRTLHGVVPRISSPRAEVANVVAFRRRKGTASMLEELANDVTGWRARSVEFFERLATTQYLDHLRPGSAYTADLRDWEALERAGSAFDRQQHTVDLRKVGSGGRYGIGNVGLFLWRLAARPIERATAARVDARRFLCHPLGIDAPLFTNPEPEGAITELATPLQVPAPISRRVLAENLAAYYGRGRSILVETREAPGQPLVAVPLGDVTVCDLSDRGPGMWATAPQEKPVAIDPVRGRLLFRNARPAGSEVRVSICHGAVADIGGGSYDRPDAFLGSNLPVVRVSEDAGDKATIQDAVAALPNGGIVEIGDSRTCAGPNALTIPTGATMVLRADAGMAPTVMLPAPLAVAVGGPDATLVIEGIVMAGHPITLGATAAGLRRLVIRHATLVPGLALDIDAAPQSTGPSLVADLVDAEIIIESSIVGGLRVSPATTAITNSILDATAPGEIAFAGAVSGAGGPLSLEAVTAVGRVDAAELNASNTLFVATAEAGKPPIRAERIQTGCVRFSYVVPGSVTPRRYRCQPEFESAAEIERREKATGTMLGEAEKSAIRAAVRARLVPSFTSMRHGRPAYLQLRRQAPPQLTAGADDEAEMGAYHSLYMPQRRTNLDVRLDEYLRFGLAAGVFYET
ncbi:hypothetical protein Sa4125_22930 [Aureimonas sp. SA4125]|uniref:hypothetical protein n=1 Tax=Aureimonas sp. SA4125 TaxID=2826993 RepID=UPI001CC7E2DD|nr:hypothetical protein [Aureimonas sp. SA4125]BDA84751.1 hypothetical protein Sa4125_22930 [Aureimonas sp. SA4125]